MIFPAPQSLPRYGAGLGLRHDHFDYVLEHRPACRWFEVMIDDYVDVGGYPRDCLAEIAKHYPIVPHSVRFSLGTPELLDEQYVGRMAEYLETIRAPWISDHLCFTMVDHTNLLDLIPLPFTTEAVETVAAKIRRIKEITGRQFLVENVTRYITVSDREMDEAQFITRVVEAADCGLLLDITNVLMNSRFHEFDPWEFMQRIPLDRVVQMHLSGWEPDVDGTELDSHDGPVPDAVWDLFGKTVARTGSTSVNIERDALIPAFTVLQAEADEAQKILEAAVPLRSAA